MLCLCVYTCKLITKECKPKKWPYPQVDNHYVPKRLQLPSGHTIGGWSVESGSRTQVESRDRSVSSAPVRLPLNAVGKERAPNAVTEKTSTISLSSPVMAEGWNSGSIPPPPALKLLQEAARLCWVYPSGKIFLTMDTFLGGHFPHS